MLCRPHNGKGNASRSSLNSLEKDADDEEWADRPKQAIEVSGGFGAPGQQSLQDDDDE